MKQLVAFIFAMASLMAAAATYTPAEVPNVHVANRNDYVANPDGVLSPAAVASLNVRLDSLRRNLTVEPMVVVVDDIDNPSNADDFATELFSLWGLGKSDKDNGLLILVVVDRHKVVIRTGYGLEGALPDITCGRIIRNVMAPAFREDNYDAGISAAVAVVGSILSDPAVAEEYRSGERDADNGNADDDDDFFRIWLIVGCVAAAIMGLLLIAVCYGMRRESDYEKYKELDKLKPYYLIVTFAFLLIPLVATMPLLLYSNYLRNHKRNCPNCGRPMHKVDEVHDNDYLTPSQDLEERIGSVDYDVWLCDNCGETDIIPYYSGSTPYVECENCHARTAREVRTRVVVRPTATRKGKAVKEYECLNCHHHQDRYFDLDRDTSGHALAAGAVLGGMMGGRSHGGGGFGGGGSFGGGFGGGMTGGGGASGSW